MGEGKSAALFENMVRMVVAARPFLRSSLALPPKIHPVERNDRQRSALAERNIWGVPTSVLLSVMRPLCLVESHIIIV